MSGVVKKTFEFLLGIVGVVSLVVFTLLLGPFLFSAIFLRLILPRNIVHRWINPLIIGICLFWVDAILWWMISVNKIEFDIKHDIELTPNQWNLIISNHQSWVDIFALFYITRHKLPVLKFFIKRQLIWVPVAGQAWWALDYPFMSRFSKSYLEKHPEKIGKDLETTKIACAKFSEIPTTIVNYLEGTRITKEKHNRQNSPFQHLLKPKAGGIAFAIQALGEKFNTVIDTTVYYPNGAPGYWDLACGRVGKISMRLRKLDIPERFLKMDYTNNADHKLDFQNWVGNLWIQKDKLLVDLIEENRNGM